MSFLATFFMEKTGFLSIFFQIQNSKRGYTRLFGKQNRGYSLFTHFRGYLDEKLIFLKTLKWI